MAKTTKVDNTVADDIVDINILPATMLKRFRIDKDNNKIIELDVSDINMAKRLMQNAETIDNILSKYETIDDENATEIMEETETEMRQLIDKVFNAKVCDIICGESSIFALIDGKFKFLYIIDVLAGLYTANVNEEVSNLQAQLAKHTSKYTQ